MAPRHPGLAVPCRFCRLRYQNIDDAPTPYGLCTFDEVLDRFKGRCYLNIDKFWDHSAEISAAIREFPLDVNRRILLKSPLFFAMPSS